MAAALAATSAVLLAAACTGASSGAASQNAEGLTTITIAEPLHSVGYLPLYAARAAGIKVVFIQTTHDELVDSPAWLARRGDPDRGVKPAVPNCATGTWGAEFYQVKPEPGEAVVNKHRYSAFAGTDLDMILRVAGIESILLTGVATNVCVESTLRDGLFLDYHVTLVEDCSAAYSQAAHDGTAEKVATCFGQVITSDEVKAGWAELVAAQ
ncbi:cysteine hydrolase [Nonomuraea sp. K274]|uniref:Cysteine hydrolase n=1 Tax=Nonomuraea cypriaca TaxID=1187855 RepID=A0A931AA76_9ACTN|nr:isochorismatase family cysteine hydrolase [Nonomuraea cypriaca]MBF8186220.1 cysteine hydrolase [Nonomuraea cypriaca]